MVDQPDDESIQDALPRITLRIPGPWESPVELHEALKNAQTGYELYKRSDDDGGLLHIESGMTFELTAIGPDDQIADVFADGGRMSDAEIAAVASHRNKVFVSGPGGSVEAARAIMKAGAALIQAGGHGVMVDNCGATHSPSDWLALASDEQMGGVYWAFVVVTGSPEEVFSTGMHCLGFRDAELPDPPDIKAGAFILHNLLGYSYQSGATIIDGEAIGGPEGAEFRLRHVECTRFAAGSPFHNPYGVWRLETIGDDED
jgi:hypothetical protein